MTALNLFLVRYVRRGNKTSATGSSGIGEELGRIEARGMESIGRYVQRSVERTDERTKRIPREYQGSRVAKTIGVIARSHGADPACMTRYIGGDLYRGEVDSRNAIHAIRAIRQIGWII